MHFGEVKRLNSHNWELIDSSWLWILESGHQFTYLSPCKNKICKIYEKVDLRGGGEWFRQVTDFIKHLDIVTWILDNGDLLW